jgi:hypothetical protein
MCAACETSSPNAGAQQNPGEMQTAVANWNLICNLLTVKNNQGKDRPLLPASPATSTTQERGC